MDYENTIIFAVNYHTSVFQSERFKLLEYDTVEHLKIKIHDAFEIPPHKQLIEGWKQVPEHDLTILQFCSHINRINYLTVKHSDGDVTVETHFDSNPNDTGEIQSTKSCIRKMLKHIATSHVKFNTTTLKNAKKCLFASPASRKAILLYLHNSYDHFSTVFAKKLNDPNISNILIKSFFVFGWDIENFQYHSALIKTLVEEDLEHLSALIETKTCAAVILQNINNRIQVLSLLIDDSLEDTFYTCLKNSQDYLTVTQKLSTSVDSSPKDYDIDSTKFQQLMADMLGDRDYDLFAYDQHKELKTKIGYAFYGPPQEENGSYKEEKQIEKINKIYELIKKHSQKFAQYQDQVEISFIYNVTEPLSKEKERRAKKHPGYNPRTDITPVPIFILRKCRNSPADACRIFIDDIGRVYDSWKNYIEDNKLPECMMVLPTNGRYDVSNNKVKLEIHESPECSGLKTALKVADLTGTVGGIGSGAVMIGAGVASITLAPAVAIGAGIVGATAGIYGLVRSAVSLADKVIHDEDLSLKNSEARGIYFNMLAGTLGFVGAGANMAVSQLAARGFNIGQGAGAVINTLGVANIGVSGASIINSGYDVFDQWYNQNQTPSLLTIVQLSSSILFFGNAVYNFRTCQTIVDETQAKVLQDYQDSLRSNRHRKTFNNLLKETINRNDGNSVQGKAEVIKSIRNIPNKDEYFAALTRNTKLMNKNGVRFFVVDGEITLNGQKISMNEFMSMSKKQASDFLSNLPTETNISNADTVTMIKNFSLNTWSLPDANFFAKYALSLICNFRTDIQAMLMQIVKDVISCAMRYFRTILDEIFPSNTATVNILNIVMEYFGGKAADYLQNYDKWLGTGSPYYYNEEYVEVPGDKKQRYIWIFEKIVTLYVNRNNLVAHEVTEIIKYVEGWILNKIYERQVNDEAEQRRRAHSPRTPTLVCCKECGGQYFINK